jgi:hypothetical protein
LGLAGRSTLGGGQGSKEEEEFLLGVVECEGCCGGMSDCCGGRLAAEGDVIETGVVTECRTSWTLCFLNMLTHSNDVTSILILIVLTDSIVLTAYCLSCFVQCYCSESLLFTFPIVLDLMLIVHPSLVEQLA